MIWVLKLILIPLTFLVLGGFFLGSVLDWTESKAGVRLGEQVTCEEDMPCWDCETMGNRICGVQIGEGVTMTREGN